MQSFGNSRLAHGFASATQRGGAAAVAQRRCIPAGRRRATKAGTAPALLGRSCVDPSASSETSGKMDMMPFVTSTKSGKERGISV